MRTARLGGFLALLACGVGAQAQTIDHSNPNTGNDDLVATQSYNWGPVFMGGLCRLTDKGSSEAVSVFTKRQVNITHFVNSFVFQILAGGPRDPSDGTGNLADGLTFTIQNINPTALGGSGGGLGYEGMDHSVAVKFDPVPNAGDPSYSSTGLFTNGQGPYGGVNLLPDLVNLRNQHPFRVDMDYNGSVLQVRITDVVTEATAHQSYKIDIARTIGSQVAYVGFTAATGLGSAAQDLQKWFFSSPPLSEGFQPNIWRNKLHGAQNAARVLGIAKSSSAWPTRVQTSPKRQAARKRSIHVAGLTR